MQPPRMVYYSKNKSELLVLTGAVYSFVAYLTAFSLEVLFIIDLAKRTNQLIALSSSSQASAINNSNFQATQLQLQQQQHSEEARLKLETLQAHLTIFCLAISILYFITFVASLILIVALILRSTFFLLVWICAMSALYLPEFGLIIYVSIYGWGIETRNGQTELLFYLFRATLNLIFILRARKLYQHWSYEKNFFLFKNNTRYSCYDSPYFIPDSLTTTINPVFSSSTLNLNRYDQIRDLQNDNNTYHGTHRQQQQQQQQRDGKSRNRMSLSRDNFNLDRYRTDNAHDLPPNRIESYHVPSGASRQSIHEQTRARSNVRHQNNNNNSMLSINDNYQFDNYEMDLDYRTLTNQHHYGNQLATNNNRQDSAMMARSQQLSYSSQSLDRRNFKDFDFTMPSQVILRPLGHEPFEYLHRPGSTSNLDAIHNNSDSSSMAYTSNLRLTKNHERSNN